MKLFTLGIAVLFGVTESNPWRSLSTFDRRTVTPAGISQRGCLFSQLAVVLFGVLIMAVQFSTPTIRSTLAAGGRMM